MIAGPQMIYVTVGKFHINYISTTARRILFFQLSKLIGNEFLGNKFILMLKKRVFNRKHGKNVIYFLFKL